MLDILKQFLLEKEIDFDDFFIKQIEVKDIILRKKKIIQKVTSEIRQIRLEEENFNQRKKFLEKNTIFKSEDFNIGKYTLRGIEPGTIVTDDCLTCDWHWEITCPTCIWTWEIKCKKCNWTWVIKKEIIKYEKRKLICPLCSWTWEIQTICPKCKGTWVIKKIEICSACKGQGKIKTGINPKNKLPIFEKCNVCYWKRKIEKMVSCNSCNWKGNIKKICSKCNGKKEIYENIEKKEQTLNPCNYCNKTGRKICPTCRWQQTLICPTCKWDRRTIQGQENKFEIEVKKDFKLLKNKFIEDYLEIIFLDEGEDLSYLYPGEKEKLKNKSVEYNLKINKENVRRIEWILFILKPKKEKTKIEYLFWISTLKKNKGKIFYKNLPPKSELRENILFFRNKVLKKLNKLKDKIIDFINKRSWKNTY